MVEAELTIAALGGLTSLLLAGAAIAGAIIAALGLGSWREEKSWQQDTELARRLLLSLRNQTDSFEDLRSRFVSAGEMSAANDRDMDVFDDNAREAAFRDAIYARLNKQGLAGRQLYPILIEADIIWHSDLETCFRELRKIENKVSHAHEMIELEERNQEKSIEVRNRLMEYRTTAFGDLDDSLNNEYRSIALRISEVARQRLGRHQ